MVVAECRVALGRTHDDAGYLVVYPCPIVKKQHVHGAWIRFQNGAIVDRGLQNPADVLGVELLVRALNEHPTGEGSTCHTRTARGRYVPAREQVAGELGKSLRWVLVSRPRSVSRRRRGPTFGVLITGPPR